MRVPVKARRLVVNALTVDVEDYFQVSALSQYIPQSKWDETPCRVERNVDLILQLLDEAGAHATFFTLGWVAERFPQLVRRIAEQGHEIASHGYAHGRATESTPEGFLADIRAREDDPRGYCRHRGQRLSRSELLDRPEDAWAHDCLAQAGYHYSSSVYPIRHDHYGVPDARASRSGLAATCSRFRSPLPACSSATGRRAVVDISG